MPTVRSVSQHQCELVSKDVETALRQEISSLPVPALIRLAADLLQTLGYHRVSILDRHFLRGRRSQAGAEITAKTGTRLTPVKIIAQVKPVKYTIQRNNVDELAGVSLRHGARYGFLITTSTISRAARSVAEESCAVPLCLIDGQELVRMLIRHRLGVKPKTLKTYELDRSFFSELSRRANAS